MSEFDTPTSERSDEANAALATVAAAIDDAMDSAFRQIERSNADPDLLAEAITYHAGFRMARRWRTWWSS